MLQIFKASKQKTGLTEAVRPRSPKTLQSLRSLWMWCVITLPLDLLMVPFLASRFDEALSLLPIKTFWIIFGASTLLLLLPLAKGFLVQLLLSSQGVQHDATQLRQSFRFLVSGGVALAVLSDLAIRLSQYEIWYAVALFALGLLAFPWWYRSMKNKDPENAPILPIAMLQERLTISTTQMDLLLTAILIGTRLGFPLLMLSLVFLGGGSTAAYIALATAFLSMLTLAPNRNDLFAICGQCGLWSRKSHQIDGFCPGCATLALKSVRTRIRRRNHFERFHKLLEGADKALEAVKLPSRSSSSR